MAEKKEIQHMILSGPPGVGKTTSAVVLAKAVFGQIWDQNFIELNASDDRKLSVIQGKVKEFARTKPMHPSLRCQPLVFHFLQFFL